jgi:hypothetical protein
MTTLLFDEKVNPFGSQAGLVPLVLSFELRTSGAAKSGGDPENRGSCQRASAYLSFLPRELSFVMTT